jgi:hypothetical protein
MTLCMLYKHLDVNKSNRCQKRCQNVNGKYTHLYAQSLSHAHTLTHTHTPPIYHTHITYIYTYVYMYTYTLIQLRTDSVCMPRRFVKLFCFSLNSNS